MADRVATALARAHAVLDGLLPERAEKRIWGSPAGKTHLAQRIVAEIPEHRVYVEPFAGGAQVLFAKEPSEVEVVSDLDPEIAFAFRFAKGITREQLERLRRKSWVGDKAHFRKLYESDVPDDEVDRFYRFAYLIRFSFNKLRRGTMPDRNVGVEARFMQKLERWAPRLKDVRVRSADYEKVVEEYDGRAEVVALAEPPDDDTRRSPSPCKPGRRQRRALSWSELLRRTFRVEVLVCARCGGPRRVIAMIQDPATARRILHHLGLPASAPPIAPARPPPQVDLDFEPAP